MGLAAHDGESDGAYGKGFQPLDLVPERKKPSTEAPHWGGGKCASGRFVVSRFWCSGRAPFFERIG
jgi:hypothetical protein